MHLFGCQRIFSENFHFKNEYKNELRDNTGDDYSTDILGLYSTYILTAITPLGQKIAQCYSPPL